jgi:hypothetical protein
VARHNVNKVRCMAPSHPPGTANRGKLMHSPVKDLCNVNGTRRSKDLLL